VCAGVRVAHGAAGDPLSSPENARIFRVVKGGLGLAVALVMNRASAAFVLACAAWSIAACTTTEPADAVSEQPLTAIFGDGNVDANKVTHVFVIGDRDGLGDQFLDSSMSRALKYKELWPDHQVLFLTTSEPGSASTLTRFGVRVLDAEMLTGSALIEQLDRLSAIASIDVYSHSNPWNASLEDPGEAGNRTLGERISDAQFERLRDNFTRYAYATFNGCSAGVWLAPHLSAIWKIPVSGALTGTNFQRLWSDGHWYQNQDGFHPTQGSWATTNTVSFADARACASAGCYRMKPENVPYWGATWWKTEGNVGGLGFYKFFCAFEGDDDRCTGGAALSLYSFISERVIGGGTDEASFEDVALDWLCPIKASGDVRDVCKATLHAARSGGARDYVPFNGPALSCDRQGCNLNLEDCEPNFRGDRRCKVSPVPTGRANTTYADELDLLMKGFAVVNAAQADLFANGGGSTPSPPSPPPSSACNGISYSGHCDKNKLVWCENDVMKTADCTATGKVCSFQSAEVGHNCVAPAACGDVDYKGSCDGDLLTWCDASGALRTIKCSARGNRCAKVDDTTGYNCVP
jgi:hypothetical protein